MADKDWQCGECFATTDPEVVNIREIKRKVKGSAEEVVVAQKIEVRCRECGWDEFIIKPLKKIDSPEKPAGGC